MFKSPSIVINRQNDNNNNNDNDDNDVDVDVDNDVDNDVNTVDVVGAYYLLKFSLSFHLIPFIYLFKKFFLDRKSTRLNSSHRL